MVKISVLTTINIMLTVSYFILQDGKQNHVSFPGIQQNGTAKQFASGKCITNFYWVTIYANNTIVEEVTYINHLNVYHSAMLAY